MQNQLHSVTLGILDLAHGLQTQPEGQSTRRLLASPCQVVGLAHDNLLRGVNIVQPLYSLGFCFRGAPSGYPRQHLNTLI